MSRWRYGTALALNREAIGYGTARLRSWLADVLSHWAWRLDSDPERWRR